MHKRLKFHRNQINLNAQEVADYLSMSKSAYSALENGSSKLDMERANKLAALYKISLEDLVNLEPPNSANEGDEKVILSHSLERVTKDLDEIKESLTQIKNKLNL